MQEKKKKRDDRSIRAYWEGAAPPGNVYSFLRQLAETWNYFPNFDHSLITKQDFVMFSDKALNFLNIQLAVSYTEHFCSDSGFSLPCISS